ncbi:hypothetical protein [Streptomyces sp. NPDC101165]|uniref:hypothetical protein n=1 Tax=Streptomyces sp. NPDC101165 TaxID=3366119 RepID=UPI00380B2BEE
MTHAGRPCGCSHNRAAGTRCGSSRPGLSGADTWTADQRKDFGNDLKDPQLLIASESANSSQSDSGPADRKPTNHAFWCTYAKDYTHIKSIWKLTTTEAEKSASATMLDTWSARRDRCSAGNGFCRRPSWT